MTTAIHRRVAACNALADPTVVARLPSGWAVMGDPQVLKGYCLLLPDPVVPHLNAMAPAARDQFLSDMGRLGDAVLAATQGVRINYALFGNLETALHAHVFPRFTDEPESLRTAHPWSYDWAASERFSPGAHGAVLQSIRQHLLAGTGASLGTPPASPSSGSLHHLDLTVSDLGKSTLFYDRWLPYAGFQRIADCAEGPLWRGERFELGLQQALAHSRMPHDRYAPGLHHLAFDLPSVQAVDRLHDILVEQAVTILDPPARYEHYSPGYYAIFFADPDGLKLEAVFTPAAE